MSKNYENEMDKLTTEMMEHICDNICKNPCRTDINQDKLDEICADCKMGKFVCDILNQYNRVNEFDKTQSYKLMQRVSELEQQLINTKKDTTRVS